MQIKFSRKEISYLINLVNKKIEKNEGSILSYLEKQKDEQKRYNAIESIKEKKALRDKLFRFLHFTGLEGK